MKVEKNVLCGVGLIFLALVIAGAIVSAVLPHRFSENLPGLKMIATNCSFPDSAMSATYSATLVPNGDYQGALDSATSFFSKYGGDVTSFSTYQNQYQTGQTTDGYGNGVVTSTIISGTIPMKNAQAFTADLQGAFSSSGNLESPSYSKTTSAQLMQSCLDDLNGIYQQQAMVALYTHELSDAIDHYIPASGVVSNYGAEGSNVDALTQQITAGYQQANSYSDGLSGIVQSVNVMAVSLTINAKDISETYYPIGSAPVPISAN